MPRRALTDRFCATAKARDGEAQTDYFDEATPGLALRVAASGYKAWTYHFTWADKRARLKIGTYPTTSLRAARTRADEAKAALEAGTDPRSIFGTSGTFKAVVEEYFVRECGMKRDAEGCATFEGSKLRSAPQRVATFEK